MTPSSPLIPLLVVRDAERALDFYRVALGATVTAVYVHGPERRVSHADLCVFGTPFAVTEEARAWNSHAPPSLGGSPVVLQLQVQDTDAAVRAMLDAGGSVVFPAQEFVGERMARVRDPFGHLWLFRQVLRELTPAEIQRARDALFERAVSAPDEETPTLSDAPPDPQATSVPKRRNGTLHLVLGPVGAGKSTYGGALARERSGVRLTLDAWFTTLFTPDRPESGVPDWYRERASRCVEQIWKVTLDIVTTGVDAILEIGLLRRAEREAFYRRVRAAHVPLQLHVLDADRVVRRERVIARNLGRGDTFSMVVSPEVFELASDLWEPVEDDEVVGLRAVFVRTDGAG